MVIFALTEGWEGDEVPEPSDEKINFKSCLVGSDETLSSEKESTLTDAFNPRLDRSSLSIDEPSLLLCISPLLFLSEDVLSDPSVIPPVLAACSLFAAKPQILCELY